MFRKQMAMIFASGGILSLADAVRCVMHGHAYWIIPAALAAFFAHAVDRLARLSK